MLKFGATDEIALEIFLGFRSSNILRTPSEGCLTHTLLLFFWQELSLRVSLEDIQSELL